MALKLLVLTALTGILVARTLAANSTLIVNELNLHYGDTVTFTGTYPREATRKVTTVQHVNPVVQVDCKQNGALVFSQRTTFGKETNNGDGTLTASTYPLALSGGSGNGIGPWLSGTTSCGAVLYYFGKDAQIHTLAYVEFLVGA